MYNPTSYTSRYNDPCSPNPCGSNTQCRVADGRPVCSCLPGHWGNPLTYCQRGECEGKRELFRRTFSVTRDNIFITRRHANVHAMTCLCGWNGMWCGGGDFGPKRWTVLSSTSRTKVAKIPRAPKTNDPLGVRV